jgi:uncharacterized membrane-anchored protein
MLVLGKSTSWNAAKTEMQNVGFISQLQTFNKNEVLKISLKKLSRYTRNELFNRKIAAQSSFAASLLAESINAIYKPVIIYQGIKTLMDKVERVQLEYKGNQRKVQLKKEGLRQLIMELKALQKNFKISRLNEKSYRKKHKKPNLD